MNILIRPLQADERNAVLPHLFAILYENMNPIDPSDESYEDTRDFWCRVINSALEDTRRTLMIVCDSGQCIGFFMYAVNCETGLFLMEEIQLQKHYHGTGIFHQIYDTVLPQLPNSLTHVEAYAHKKNLRSQGILHHFGLQVVGENKNGNSWHFQGDYPEFLRKMYT